ncbi:InlB B-repeat-containing protein [Cohnella thailandensis]|uniref:InlB B-repeat-containing protein n=1 Tax=Cohnella thailandensis TaxID=557557 RepID=A0A841SYJ1_9BACL|nr:InlB B-repeat-containing protein [Cohnella thailandensis]MBB6635238.1 InlB B-repeat-containing protein [Cohnella thailandensis]MBP1974294.1 putative repeat protein (TIGR02543 family) [Cohnella thailandensis]
MKRAGNLLLSLLVLLSVLQIGENRAQAATGEAVAPQLAATEYFSLALLSDGTVWGWGRGGSGQLGNGKTGNYTYPVKTAGLSGVQSIGIGYFNGYAVLEDGSVWAWGKNDYGQIGDGTTTGRISPVQVQGLSGIKKVSSGSGQHALAIDEYGDVWAWGSNESGQLGDGTIISRETPVLLMGLSDIKEVATGGSFSLALKDDGTVWSWGWNKQGQLGAGLAADLREDPQPIPGLSGIVAISAGYNHALALDENGRVWAWGQNTNGAVGDGTYTERRSPVQVAGLDDVATISAGYFHNLVIKKDGTVWGWGFNHQNQLGDGSTTTSTTPIRVPGLERAAAVAAGQFHSLAMDSDGFGWAWGYNSGGPLGDKTEISRPMPVRNAVVMDVTAPFTDIAEFAASDITTTGMTLNWDKASDNMTESDRLQYAVYQSEDGSIYSPQLAEKRGTLLMDYTADVDTFAVSGLTPDTGYFFNVIVKDAAGNKSPYTMIWESTLPTYAVTYDGNGSSGGTVPEDAKEYAAGEKAAVLGQGSLARESYTFKGWNTKADGSGDAYAENDELTVASDVTLFAQWTKIPTYTVTYDGNGSTGGMAPVDSNEYEAGEKAAVLGQGGLARESYTFKGWNTKADGSGVAYEEGDELMVNADVTLYAQWDAIPIPTPTYTVTYDGNGSTGGTVPVDSNEYEAGEKAAVLGQGSLARESFTFKGWNTKADGSGDAYEEDDELTVNADVTLYAQWDAIPIPTPTYTVTYDGNGSMGGAAPVDASEYEAGDKATVLGQGSLARESYTFKGWNTKADGSGVAYEEGDELTVNVDVTLYAQWDAIPIPTPTYKVTYDGNGSTGGTAPVDSNEYEAGEEATVRAPGDLAREGYAFAGWDTKANGSGATYMPGELLTIGTSPVTLYAQWATVPVHVPEMIRFQPVGGATGISVNAPLAMAFNKEVRPVAGKRILIESLSGDRISQTIDAADAEQVEVFGSTVRIQPANPLSYGTLYRVTIEAGAFADSDGNEYGGLADGWEFQTVEKPIVPPPSSDATLAGLDVIVGTQKLPLSPSFAAGVARYSATVPSFVSSVSVSATVYASSSSVTASVYDGNNRLAAGPLSLISGQASDELQIGYGMNRVVLTVTAENGTQHAYTVDVTRELAYFPPVQLPESSSEGNEPDTIAYWNGQTLTGIVNAASEEKDGRATIRFTVNATELESRLEQSANSPIFQISSSFAAEQVVVELNGEIVKALEKKQATLEIRTTNGSYRLPAVQVLIDNLARQLGQEVALADIAVQIRIGQSSAETVASAEQAANAGGYRIVAAPVEFSVVASFGGHTAETDRFGQFVEREIPLPEGIDRSKVTTAVVVEPNGAARHAPTRVIERDGRLYAVVSSLTNSDYALVDHSAAFADVNGHWSREAVNEMASRMIVNGTDGSHYKPDAAVTRAEFAAIVVRALGLPDTGTASGFADVEDGAWYAGAADQAQRIGLIEGYSDGTFRPNATITREEAVAITARAMELVGVDTVLSAEDSARILSAFKDAEDIGSWAKPSAAAAVANGLAAGSGSRFMPGSKMTRAETAAIVQRLLKQAGLID